MIKNLLANADAGDTGSIARLERSPGEEMATHSRIFTKKFHGQKSLVNYSPWGCKQLDTTEQLNSKESNTGIEMNLPSSHSIVKCSK